MQAGWISPRLGTPRSARDEYGANFYTSRRFYPSSPFHVQEAMQDHRIVPSRPATGTGSLSAR